MTLSKKHSKSNNPLQRFLAGVLAVLMVVVLATPAFAECACCEDMMTSDVMVNVEETSASCHTPEPILDAPMSCHEEESPEPARHPAEDIIAGCQFECAEAIAITGLTTEYFIASSNPVKVEAPATNSMLTLLNSDVYSANVTQYESPPDLTALFTQQYSSILPPRI